VDRIENVLFLAAELLLFFLMILVFMNAIMRYLFNSPISGMITFIEDYVLVLMVFSAVSRVEANREQIKVDILVGYIPPAVRTPLLLASYVASIILFGFMIKAFLEIAYTQWVRNAIASTWGYPIAPARFLIAFGLLILIIRMIQTMVSVYRHE
jgi:TRAP-type C4-dicarboxylate transport system permease small subunit